MNFELMKNEKKLCCTVISKPDDTGFIYALRPYQKNCGIYWWQQFRSILF